ncbi:Pro-opiomelanocortin A, partial [Eudyptes chrysolophus]
MPSALWSSLPVVLGLLLWHPAGTSGLCWESSKCQDLASEAGVLVSLGMGTALQLLSADLSAEAPVYPGNGHLQPLSESIRKYVMSHFRWNKFGRRNSSSGGGGHKREEAAGGNPPPASLPTVPPSHREEEQGTGLEREEGKRSYSMEHFRWGKPVGRKRRPIKVYPNGVEEELAESYPLEFKRELVLGSTGVPPEEEEEEEEGQEEEKKAGGSYRMRHFRWHAPLKDKRYGGFMTSEHSQTPLVTLFKNAIIKSAYKKGQ